MTPSLPRLLKIATRNWSKKSKVVATAFQAQHGREPTPAELKAETDALERDERQARIQANRHATAQQIRSWF